MEKNLSIESLLPVFMDLVSPVGSGINVCAIYPKGDMGLDNSNRLKLIVLADQTGSWKTAFGESDGYVLCAAKFESADEAAVFKTALGCRAPGIRVLENF